MTGDAGRSQFPFWPQLALATISLALWNGQSSLALAQEKPCVVDVFVALADNAHQGIVPVPAALGNGDEPQRNLYWGAAFGVKTFFRKSAQWKQVAHSSASPAAVLERTVFQHVSGNAYLVADAYRGIQIKQAIADFFESAAGIHTQPAIQAKQADGKEIQLSPSADLTVYVGHDGLMDFALDKRFSGTASGGPRKGFVEDKEYTLLAKHATDLWLRTFIAIGFSFGWRKSEMLGLRVSNVDLLEGWLEIGDSKNGEGRKAKLTHELQTLLAECIRAKSPDDFLLTRPDGSRIAQTRKDWYSLCCRCGLGKLDEKGRYSGLQMHDLRRSAVRRMIRRGVPEKVAMLISGHKTRSIFDRYNIGNERDLEQAAELLESPRQVPEVENRHTTDTSSFAHS
jgi:integrase